MYSGGGSRGYTGYTDKNVLNHYLTLDLPDDHIMCEYIWIDGTGEGIRSKCKTLDFEPTCLDGINYFTDHKTHHVQVYAINDNIYK